MAKDQRLPLTSIGYSFRLISGLMMQSMCGDRSGSLSDDFAHKHVPNMKRQWRNWERWGNQSPMGENGLTLYRPWEDPVKSCDWPLRGMATHMEEKRSQLLTLLRRRAGQ